MGSQRVGHNWVTFTRSHPIYSSYFLCHHRIVKVPGTKGYFVSTVLASHSSTFAWKTPWTEEPGGLQSMGSLRVGHDWATSLSFFTFMHWRRNWQPTPVFLPGESQGQGSLVGCIVQSMGSHRVGHDWRDLAAVAAWSEMWSDELKALFSGLGRTF